MNFSRLKKLLLALGLMAVCAASFAVFDPVNDDTDLFRNNPNIPAQRPNVLIIIDNTANWNSAFANEKAALISVVNGLDSSFNVGLMYFTGSGGATDGAAVRFGVRQMTPTNKARLAQMLTRAELYDLLNYSGYEEKEAYPEFQGLISTIAGLGEDPDHGCGRAMWEYEPELDRFGTPMALMLLPMWTHGCIDSMEGLFFESAATRSWPQFCSPWMRTRCSLPRTRKVFTAAVPMSVGQSISSS